MFPARPIYVLFLVFLSCGIFSRVLTAQDILRSASNILGFGLTRAEAPSKEGMTLDAEDRFAWDEFASLVHPITAVPPVNNVSPEWNKWKDKCKAGLRTSCQSISAHPDSKTAVDAASAEIPRQVLIDFGNSKWKHEESSFVQSYVRAPQLASVLFNPEAAASIQRNLLGRRSTLDLAIKHLDENGLKGTDRRLPPGTFENGSEITKLVWEILPATGQLSLFDPANPPLETGTNQLYHVPSWLSRYALDPDINKACPVTLPAYGSPDKPVNVPINCFYWFKVRGTEDCDSLSSEVFQVWCQEPIKDQDFYAVLIAFHVMKLVATSPDWIWMTYYWTRDVNDDETGSGAKWAAPWNHFHEFSTTAIREKARPGHQICFNPYLEGTDRNGVKANCLSCHTFSAFSPTDSKVAGGTTLGATYPYSLSRRKRDERKYFKGAMQTGLVWSLSTNQDSNTETLLTSFKTAIAAAILNQFQ